MKREDNLARAWKSDEAASPAKEGADGAHGNDRKAPASAMPVPLPGGNETVLLVEDEENIRGMTAQFLASLGYCVLPAANGAAALRLAEQHGQGIDVLVTDVALPGIRGTEVAERLRASQPGVRVLFVSGDSEAPGKDGEHMLEKPFDLTELARSIREVLQ